MTQTTEPRIVARLLRRRSRRRDAVDRFDTMPTRDPRGGIAPVEVLLARMATLHSTITAAEAAGSQRHRRTARWQRWMVRLLPLLDGLVLWWFLVGVLNVDLRTSDPTMLVAVGLAVLCTAAVAAWTATVGEHMRDFKNDDRAVEWSVVDGLGRGMLVLSGLMALLLGALMYTRVADEVYQATGIPGAGANLVAGVLAFAVVLVNLFVLYLSFADGSEQTTQLDRLGRVVGRPVRRRHRHLTGMAADQQRIVLREAAWERLRGSVPAGPTAPELRAGADDASVSPVTNGSAHGWWR